MMNYPLISIIVPIYNVEKYLNKCIDSIIKQSFKNIEILLVIGESPDNCLSICESYVKTDSRIKIVYRANGGLADARNAGLEVAKGEYVLFIDSDDWIIDECLDEIAKIINKTKVDVIIGKFLVYNEGKIKGLFYDTNIQGSKVNGCEKHSVVKYLYSIKLSPAAWRYAINRKMLLRKDLFFYKGIYAEDSDWTPRLLCSAESFWVIDKPFYQYRKRNDSLDSHINLKKSLDLMLIINRLFDYSYKLNNKFYSTYILGIAHLNCLLPIILYYDSYNVEGKSVIDKWIKENKNLIKNMQQYHFDLSVLEKIFGLFLGVKIYMVWQKMKVHIVARIKKVY